MSWCPLMRLRVLYIGVLAVLSVVFLPLCVAKGHIGDRCNWDSECDPPTVGAYCSEGYCACRPEYVLGPYGNSCVIETGHICPSYNNVCQDPNARCTRDHPCECIPSFAVNAENHCSPRLGTACNSTYECISGACIDGVCACTVTGLVPDLMNVSCLPDLHVSCSDYNACADPSAECQEGVCECRRYHQPTPGHQWQETCLTSLGAPCNSTSECADVNSGCVQTVKRAAHKACVCKESYVPDSGRRTCLPVTPMMGGPCQEDLQCSAKFGRGATCGASKRCGCSGEYYYDDEEERCLRSCSCPAPSAPAVP